MNIEKKTSIGVVGYDICGVNLNEMRQLTELKNRISNVLDSHTKDSEKKEYIDDKDLKLMWAILSVFTKDYEDAATSAFDEFLANENKPQSPNPVDDKE